MTELHTFRNGENNSADITQWVYEEASGLLLRKTYADGKSVTYDYYPDGKLKTRTWSRGIATTYTYNTLGELIKVDYSDSTPDITYTYTRIGLKDSNPELSTTASKPAPALGQRKFNADMLSGSRHNGRIPPAFAKKTSHIFVVQDESW